MAFYPPVRDWYTERQNLTHRPPIRGPSPKSIKNKQSGTSLHRAAKHSYPDIDDSLPPILDPQRYFSKSPPSPSKSHRSKRDSFHSYRSAPGWMPAESAVPPVPGFYHHQTYAQSTTSLPRTAAPRLKRDSMYSYQKIPVDMESDPIPPVPFLGAYMGHEQTRWSPSTSRSSENRMPHEEKQGVRRRLVRKFEQMLESTRGAFGRNRRAWRG